MRNNPTFTESAHINHLFNKKNKGLQGNYSKIKVMSFSSNRVVFLFFFLRLLLTGCVEVNDKYGWPCYKVQQCKIFGRMSSIEMDVIICIGVRQNL